MDKWVLEEPFGLRSLVGVEVQASLNKIVELLRPLGWLLQSLYRFVLELPHRNEGFQVGVGGFSFCQFDGGDS